MSDLVLKDSDHFGALAQAMGMTADSKQGQKSTLARLKINHTGNSEETVVKGKKKTVFVVDPGLFSLELTDGTTLYQQQPTVRLYNQRFMYKRYVASEKNFVKSIMATTWKNMELPDTNGTINCGRSAGFNPDFDSLPEDAKALIRSVKRVRVWLGTVTFDSPIDSEGKEVEPVKDIPFVYDIDNPEGFKTMETPILDIAERGKLLPHFKISLDTEQRSIPTGNKFYIPTAELLPEELAFTDQDQKLFVDFNDWITNNNNWVMEQRKGIKDVPDAEVNVIDNVPEPTKKPSKKTKEVKQQSNEELVEEWDD